MTPLYDNLLSVFCETSILFSLNTENVDATSYDADICSRGARTESEHIDEPSVWLSARVTHMRLHAEKHRRRTLKPL